MEVNAPETHKQRRTNVYMDYDVSIKNHYGEMMHETLGSLTKGYPVIQFIIPSHLPQLGIKYDYLKVGTKQEHRSNNNLSKYIISQEPFQKMNPEVY